MAKNKQSADVLIFDDDKYFLRNLEGMLNLMKLKVVTCHSSGAARRLVRSPSSKFLVLILDIMDYDDTPVGLELLRLASPSTSGVKVIMTSKHEQFDHAVESINEGAFAFIRKRQVKADEIFRMIENAVDAARTERQRRIDLAGIAQIQRDFQPAPSGMLEHFDFAVRSIPCEGESISGDFFSFVDCGEGKTGIFMGDVMGHGLASSFVTGIALGCLAFLDFRGTTPETAIERFHERLSRALGLAEGGSSYISASICIVDNFSNQISYGILGQTSPIFLYRDETGACDILRERHFIPIGMAVSSSVASFSGIELREGDLLVMCTDGCEKFDEGLHEAAIRIKKRVERVASRNLDSVCDGILEQAVPQDDKTVLAIRRKRS